MKTDNELRAILNDFDWKYDPWGTVMLTHFAICDEMLFMGYYIPYDWGFKPGMCHTNERDYESGYAEYFEDVPEAKLIRWGNILSRYAAKLKVSGKDY